VEASTSILGGGSWQSKLSLHIWRSAEGGAKDRWPDRSHGYLSPIRAITSPPAGWVEEYSI